MGSDPQTSIDLIVSGGELVTMVPGAQVMSGAAVACAAGDIVDIGPAERLLAANPEAEVIDASGCVVIPGLINAHQHTTADPLFRSCIPDLLGPGEAIFDWAVPIHEVLTAQDDEVAAALTALSCLRSGTTMLVEAGTVAHPEAVAAGLGAAGIRATLGRWGWDEPGVAFSAPADEVLAAQADLIGRWPAGGLTEGWVTLVGHSLVSDQLMAGAADLARSLGVGLTIHMSPTSSDPEIYLERHGRRPLVHLDELGVLGPELLLSHAVWLDDSEVSLVLERDVAIAYCPWAYLRLGQGATVAGRHAEIVEAGGRVGLGCDAANASDHHDILSAAALAAGLARDSRVRPESFGALTALELATIGGARAVGKGDQLGSIEVGKAADLVVVDASGIDWAPRGDVAMQLVWGNGGRYVRDVVVNGKLVLKDGHSTRIDEAALIEAATERHAAVAQASGIDL